MTTSIENEGPLALQLGHKNINERNLEGCTRALDRAVSAESDGVVFPSSFFNLSFREDVISRCQHRKLRIIHQITTDALANEPSEFLETELIKRLEAGDAINIVFGANSVPSQALLMQFDPWPQQTYFTYSARSKDDVTRLLESLSPYVCERLFFHFPFHTAFGDGHLSCAKINKLVVELKKRLPHIRVRPPLGVEMFDPRVDSTLDLEPLLSPVLELRSGDGADHKNRLPIEVSVIIPSYNNRDYLVNTVKHLSRQDFPRSAFEIVVVDDGSTDQTEAAVRELAVSLDGKINLKYIYSPRPSVRKMGDANYRAGISRNLGVKNSRGKILCFLDSDILTPPEFITDLVDKHRSYDVVQCKRLNLVNAKSDHSIRYESIDPGKDTFSTENGYWEKFYLLEDWGKAPFFWKYTCTYGLSISARLFKRVGWIRRGFVFYGFEDVELGYRLSRVGARFHLNNMVTYHLFHKNERSEFRNSDFLRQSLLAKTAQIFYLGLLDPEIFFHFRGLMKEQLPIGGILVPLLKAMGVDKVPPQYAARIQIPLLAIRNWRFIAWRQKNRLGSFYSGTIALRLRFWTDHVRATLWRVRVPVDHAKTIFSRVRGALWRVQVAAARIAVPVRQPIVRIRGSVWRVQVAIDRARAPLWRLRVPIDIVRGQLWRLRVPIDIVRGQLWRLRVPIDVVRGQLWRLRVPFDVVRGQLWRAPVAVQRLQSSFWRIPHMIDRGRNSLWRLRVVGYRIRAVTWTLLRKISYPARKVYYFTTYQWNARVRKFRGRV